MYIFLFIILVLGPFHREVLDSIPATELSPDPHLCCNFSTGTLTGADPKSTGCQSRGAQDSSGQS